MMLQKIYKKYYMNININLVVNLVFCYFSLGNKINNDTAVS